MPLKYKKIFENSEFIVINKPAGLLVHGAIHIKEKTLADQLLANYPELAEVGENPCRPGIMHRLDRFASGLIVIAKTKESFNSLKNQFKTRTVEKYYIVLVYGKIEKNQDEINFPIQRSSSGYKMAALPTTIKGTTNPKGKTAITEFEILKKYINYTLLKIKIKTGRTHQIRAHMSAYGHPVVGDNIYGTKKTKIKNIKLNLGRMLVRARGFDFIDLQGERKIYTTKLPDDLRKILNEIK